MEDYIIMQREGDICPLCGQALELLVDLEDASAPVHGERCTSEDCTFWNDFQVCEWPREKELIEWV